MPKLGVENNLLKPCPDTPNCVSSQASRSDKQHYIEPIIIDGNPVDAQKVLLHTLEAFSRVEVVTAEADYIHAEFTSLVFRFVDDVEFYMPAYGTDSENADSGTVRVDVRSASRVGTSDLGVNRKRVEAIKQALGTGESGSSDRSSE